jgi:hypothetical protein
MKGNSGVAISIKAIEEEYPVCTWPNFLIIPRFIRSGIRFSNPQCATILSSIEIITYGTF